MYKKIDRTRARKAYNAGKTIYLLPSKVRFCLNAPFIAPFAIDKVSCDNRDFDLISNEYCYYNCNEELGRAVHYYIEAKA